MEQEGHADGGSPTFCPCVVHARVHAKSEPAERESETDDKRSSDIIRGEKGRVGPKSTKWVGFAEFTRTDTGSPASHKAAHCMTL